MVSQDLRTIRFGVGANSVSPTLINIAVGEPLGFYAETGLSLEIVPLGSNAAMLDALRDQSVEFAVGTASFQLPILVAGGELPALNFYEYAYPFKYDLAVLPE